MSLSKSETARLNGAKSQGPITPAGKLESAANSLRHGLAAKAVVLPTESRADYETLLAAYLQRFLPADQLEMDLVESMAASRWRLRRVANIETHLLAEEIAARALREDEPKDNDQLLACAFRSWRDSFTSLTRYENSLNRTFDRALKQLQALQKTRPAPPPVELQNEPKPVLLPWPVAPTASPRAIVNMGSDSSPLPNHDLLGVVFRDGRQVDTTASSKYGS